MTQIRMTDLPVLVVAGPRLLGPYSFRASLDIDRFFAGLEERHLVIHGGATGVDTMCMVSARRHGHEVQAYPVKRSDAHIAEQRWGARRKAPLARTIRMLDAVKPTGARVWWDGESAGTGFTIGELKRRAIPTVVVRVDVTPEQLAAFPGGDAA